MRNRLIGVILLCGPACTPNSTNQARQQGVEAPFIAGSTTADGILLASCVTGFRFNDRRGISIEALNGSIQKVVAYPDRTGAYLRDGSRFRKDSLCSSLWYAVRYAGDSSQIRLALTAEYAAKNCKAVTNCTTFSRNRRGNPRWGKPQLHLLNVPVELLVGREVPL